MGPRLLRVEMDETAFVVGRSLIESIERGVKTSNKLICVLSPDFVASDWTALEYQMKVLDDPAGRKGLIIPILYRECDVPYSMRIRVGADFRKKENHDRAYRRLLVALGVVKRADFSAQTGETESGPTSALQSGYLGSHEPDAILEPVALNVFEVVKTPEWIWHANSRCRTPMEVVESAGGRLDITFALNSGQIWTFATLDSSESPLHSAIDSEAVNKTLLAELLVSETTRDLAIEILNKTLTSHFRRLGVWYDKRHGRYYFPPDFGKKHAVAWPGLKKRATRTVTVPRFRDGGLDRFEHLAAVMRFVQVDGKLCLQVLPTRMVTEDGYRPMRGQGVGRRIGKLTRKVYNNAFWLDVMFWIHQLYSNGRILINTGGPDIEISAVQLSISLGGGILGDKLSMFDSEYIERWHTLALALEEETSEEEASELEGAREDLE